ncbi:hypothetical protein JCM6292_2047 [Bacteroides pyogenes JCM 6292]|uniref:DUF4468 domain-containing protein n=2 Tax=Bacteroides pyogenes TaxID=310300 RepID=W4PEW6_9BACE|nr:DUF4468 domain-containing protein [Bacteroides pyogenes]GAE15726.1 hypothetical protein JCM6292_2047 [Bacteroides pyogenes JCM 6292]GAE17724.1 hypothetical protein JCM6294_509 [Bacteroides pyogenes DSM 20611 = JCM 6294]
MKRLLILLALLPMFVMSQNNYTINDDGSLSFVKIINSSIDKSSSELFGNVLVYLGKAYADVKNVIQIKNDENRFIIAKGVFSNIFSWTNSMMGRETFFEVPHTLRIDCKDGKIKVEYIISQYIEIEGNWIHPEEDQRICKTSILSKYPIASPKKLNKISREEKRYKDAFENLINIIELQFNEIQKSINTNESDW